MNKTEVFEHGQVTAVLDSTLNVFNELVICIVKDVLNKEQFEALNLSLKVIEEISNEIHDKIEKEGSLK